MMKNVLHFKEMCEAGDIMCDFFMILASFDDTTNKRSLNWSLIDFKSEISKILLILQSKIEMNTIFLISTIWKQHMLIDLFVK